MPDPVVHFEIISSEAPALHRFYGSVFGWKIAVDNPFGYGLVDTRTPGRGISGGIGAPTQGARGHLTVYVQVPNIDSALSRVITEGGRIAMPKTTVPNGPTLAQFIDPAGHLMGLIEGASSDSARPRGTTPARHAPGAAVTPKSSVQAGAKSKSKAKAAAKKSSGKSKKSGKKSKSGKNKKKKKKK